MASNLKRHFGLAVVFAAGMSASTFAQAFDPLNDVFEMIGIKEREKPTIDYRERAPLVVPPTLGKLRQPEKSAEERNPNWPQDPDLLARRRKAEEARAPTTMELGNGEGEGKLVRGAEGQVRNRNAGVPSRAQPSNSTGNESDRQSLMVSPEQIKNIYSAERAASSSGQTPGVEPGRQYLTEPPKGYRQAAAGARAGKASVEPMADQSDSVQINALRPNR